MSVLLGLLIVAVGACTTAPAPTPSPSPTPGGIDRNAEVMAALDELRAASTSPVELSMGQGVPTAVRARVPVSGATPAEQALDYLSRYRELYGLAGRETGLRAIRASAEAEGQPGVAIFQQTYRGIPVYGAELAVPVHGGFALGSAGTIRPHLLLQTEPEIDAAAAIAAAAPDDQPTYGTPQLTVLDFTLLGSRAAASLDAGRRGARLAWLVNVLGADPAEVLVDAGVGDVLLRVPRSSDAFGIDVRDFKGEGKSSDYGCWTLQGIDAASFADPQWQAAVTNFSSTYDFYLGTLSRHSYDGHGSPIWAFINADHGDRANASNDNTCTLQQFSPGWVTDDVVTHEFTHAVTFHTAGLKYFGESGALNESYSDVLAYAHTGDPQLGEALPAMDLGDRSFLRDISAPPTGRNEYSELNTTLFNDDGELFPDHWYVHSNSAIPNYAAWLIANGGVHPDNGVLVSRTGDEQINGIGPLGMAELYYRTLRTLPSNTSMHGQRALTLAAAFVMGFSDRETCVVVNAFAAIGLGDQDTDCDGVLEPLDADNDAINDRVDNCLGVANTAQLDLDVDGEGDDCDDDVDGDGVPQVPSAGLLDNCPYVANPDQSDMNFNGVGAACDGAEDGDIDNDGVLDGDDNCPHDYNPVQVSFSGQQPDVDNDGEGDACDPDPDGDAITEQDNCPDVANADQADGDGDRIGDACDPCPDGVDDSVAWGTIGYFDANGDYVYEVVVHVADADGDGVPDGCDSDGIGRGASAGGRDGGGVDLRVGDGDAVVSSDAIVIGDEGGEVGLRINTCAPRCDAVPEVDHCVAVRVDGTDESTRVGIRDDSGSIRARPAEPGAEMRLNPRGGESYDLVFALLADTAGDEVGISIGRCGSGVPAPTATPSGAIGLPSFKATVMLEIDGAPHSLSDGSCRSEPFEDVFYYALNFNEPGEHYFSIVLESDEPIAGGSYSDGMFSTLMISGVLDQNIRIEELVLDADLLGGSFRARGSSIDPVTVTGSFDC